MRQPDLASPRFKANPYPFYAHLRDEAPVYRATLPGKKTAWLITRYDDVLAVPKDDRFAKDPLHAQTAEQRRKAPWGFRWAVLMSRILRRDSVGERKRHAVRSMWRRGIHQGRTGSTGTSTLPVSCMWATDNGALRLRL